MGPSGNKKTINDRRGINKKGGDLARGTDVVIKKTQSPSEREKGGGESWGLSRGSSRQGPRGVIPFKRE